MLRMKLQTILLAICLVSGCLVSGSGCSDSDTPESTTDVTTQEEPAISGVVQDASGDPIDGSIVIAMDRTTNTKFRTETRPDGSYSLALPTGTYDVAFDDGGAHGTQFFGPVEMTGESQSLDLALDIPASASEEVVVGTISDVNGASVEGYEVRISSALVELDEDHLLGTATLGSDGSFSIETGGERAMDIDVYDGDGELVEFIDIAKLEGPCYVEFEVGSDVVNQHRHNEDSDDHETLDHSSDFDHDAGSVVNKHGSNDRFAVTVTNPMDIDDVTQPVWVVTNLRGGKLGVGGGHIKITEDSWGLFEGPDDPVDQVASCFCQTLHVHHEASLEFDIYVKDDGSWWYDYKIHAYARDHYHDLHFHFWDETGDDYKLSVDESSWKWHTVSYNSHHPTLTRIEQVQWWAGDDGSSGCPDCW